MRMGNSVLLFLETLLSPIWLDFKVLEAYVGGFGVRVRKFPFLCMLWFELQTLDPFDFHV